MSESLSTSDASPILWPIGATATVLPEVEPELEKDEIKKTTYTLRFAGRAAGVIWSVCVCRDFQLSNKMNLPVTADNL